MNKTIAAENLFEFAKIADMETMPFMLAFGTLLGAVRDGDFIDHDTDTDVIILSEHLPQLDRALDRLIGRGFKLNRKEPGVISISRNGEYIDVYPAYPHWLFWRKLLLNCPVPREMLEQPKQIKFRGGMFYKPAPAVAYLKLCYGEGWRQPVEGYHAQMPTTIWRQAKEFVKELLK